MTRSLPRLLVLLFLPFWALGSMAQSAEFTATVDRNVLAAGERLVLSITLTNSRSGIEAPDLGGLVVMQGPFQSSSMNFINGRMSSSITQQWILTAQQPGKYTIGPATAKAEGQLIRTAPITIEVTKPKATTPGPQSVPGQRNDPNLFISLDLSSRKVYVGEQLVATYSLYWRYPYIERPWYELPKLDGFWAEDVDSDQRPEERVETINGVQYRVAVLKRQVLFPQRSGSLRIEPMKFSCQVRSNWMSPGRAIETTSNAAEITVMPLPNGAPPDFKGAVGDLQMQVRPARTTLKADDAIDLVVKISGRSNLRLIEAPQLDLPPDFETYDPKIVDKISVTAGGVSGSREFQYLIIPRHEGSYPLDGIQFSFFDPKAGAYRTITSEAITFEVAPGDGTGGAQVQRARSREVQTLDQDIRYIRTGPLELRPRGQHLFASSIWFAGMAAPALSVILLLVWHRRHERERADTEGMRRRQADKLARRHLKLAGKALEQGDHIAFHTALSRALNGYFADKLGLGIGAIDGRKVEERLAQLPDGTEVANTYARLIAVCDMARFAPSGQGPERALYEEAASLIQRTEHLLRK